MHNTFVAPILLAVLATLGACSKKDESRSPAPAAKPAEGGTVSCVNPSKSTCTDFADAAAGKQQCELMSGTFAAAACSQAGKLGGCSLANGKQQTFYPGEEKLDAATAQQECASMGGTWKP